MAPLSVKACYKHTKRRFSLEPSSTFADFQAKLAAIFSIPAPRTILYKDDEDDLVAVSSDSELAELFAIATSASITPLRVYLYDTAEDVSAAEQASRQAPNAEVPRPPSSAEPDRSHDPMPQLDSVFSGVSQILSTIFNDGRNQPFRSSRRSHPCGWRSRSSRSRRPDMPTPPPPFFNMYGPIASFISAMANSGGGPPDIMSNLSRVSQDTRDAFDQARQAVLSAEDPMRIINAARAGAPVVRSWMNDNLGSEGPVREESVPPLVRDLEAAIGEGFGSDITDRAMELVRVALRDQVVVDMLRMLPEDFSFSWDAEMVPPGESYRTSGFSVHTGVECDNCGKQPVRGSRFMATNRENYDLCDSCYNDETVDKQGIEFKECKYIWEARLGDAVVPSAPLSMWNRGPSVAFLQKLLTDLGFMNENMYRRAVGMYGPKTKAAVMQFQREHGLSDVVESGVYDATTAASLVSIIETQVPPTAATGSDPAESGPSSATTTAPESSPARG
ncbi:unnamed protein product [Chondrus crispus]|uniref:PB1 domain-containing protein n=1 Tax=Chondrus crispus TaxID=2769 RepID=R7QME1_CHOCR|nr:unnamed protein product [Chondrus crispus]CDF38540.1 unnamed protein product [Chondrus crispus]|eukprot:XP_005718433.1 unnamed protein product [Chondrus crispus]